MGASAPKDLPKRRAASRAFGPLGLADYQMYLSHEPDTGNFVAMDVPNRKVAWRVTGPAPFWAGAVATSGGLVFTGDMRGYFMAIDSGTGAVLWKFQTGSGIIGSPITYELDGVQYVAVPSGGIGGDMGFDYTEPKAGNFWVFRGPNIFRTMLSERQFLDRVINGGRNGMRAWGSLLSTDDIWKVHAFVMSRERL